VPPPRQKPPLEYEGNSLTTLTGKITQVSYLKKNTYKEIFIQKFDDCLSCCQTVHFSRHYQNITCSLRRTQQLIPSIYSKAGTYVGRINTTIRLPTENDHHWATNTKYQSKVKYGASIFTLRDPVRS